MLLHNINPFRGQVNGARYTLKALYSKPLLLELLIGNNVGFILALPEMSCGPGDSNFLCQGFKRTEFLLRVCFPVTVNKAHGQSSSGAVGDGFK